MTRREFFTSLGSAGAAAAAWAAVASSTTAATGDGGGKKVAGGALKAGVFGTVSERAGRGGGCRRDVAVYIGVGRYEGILASTLQGENLLSSQKHSSSNATLLAPIVSVRAVGDRLPFAVLLLRPTVNLMPLIRAPDGFTALQTIEAKRC